MNSPVRSSFAVPSRLSDTSGSTDATILAAAPAELVSGRRVRSAGSRQRPPAPAARREANQAFALFDHGAAVFSPVGVLAGDHAVVVDEQFPPPQASRSRQRPN
jgi:hypothetical protein